MNNSVPFNTFTMLYNHDLYLAPKHFHHPQNKPRTQEQSLPHSLHHLAIFTERLLCARLCARGEGQELCCPQDVLVGRQDLAMVALPTGESALVVWMCLEDPGGLPVHGVPKSLTALSRHAYTHMWNLSSPTRGGSLTPVV